MITLTDCECSGRGKSAMTQDKRIAGLDCGIFFQLMDVLADITRRPAQSNTST